MNGELNPLALMFVVLSKSKIFKYNATMKTLSIIFYAIGSVLLIISCFTMSITATWWLGGIAVACLIAGCIFQFNSNRHNNILPHDNR